MADSGSLLNDLLADLNLAPTGSDGGEDDLFALLERELASTNLGDDQAEPGSTLPASSAAGIVVSHQSHVAPHADGGSDDAWSAALSSMGNFSLAADFLAADSMAKTTAVPIAEEKEEDAIDLTQFTTLEELESAGGPPPGLLGLLGTAQATPPAKPDVVAPVPPGIAAQQPSGMAPPPAQPATGGAMPPGMAAPPQPMPPQLMPPPGAGPPPPMGGPVPPQMMPPMPPPGAGPMPPMLPPMMGMGPTPPGGLPPGVPPVRPGGEPGRFYFNNPHPNAPPVSLHAVATKSMPVRDLGYAVHSMIRPLQSLDAYSDDYYHLSLLNLAMGYAVPGLAAAPVGKDVKAMAKEMEAKFLESAATRAKTFAEEKKSLGTTVRSNVNRPKALLNTRSFARPDDDDEDKDDGKAASDYEAEQKRLRIALWRARVAIDRGYSSYLSLVELRRLIGASGGDARLMSDLMPDVRANVDRIHRSLGLSVSVGDKGRKSIVADGDGLATCLSLPKGRVLAARVVEGGILPHPSACVLLSPAVREVYSSPVDGDATAAAASGDGRDRLLGALLLLVVTPSPAVEPAVLCDCLKGIADVGEVDGGNGLLTGSQMRMRFLHALLSTGKERMVEGAEGREAFLEDETRIMRILAAA